MGLGKEVTMKYETIQFEMIDENIGKLSLNRPRKFNLVNEQMMVELELFWKDRLLDLETRVLVFNGNGNRGFCAGLDMKELMKKSPDMNIEKFYRLQRRLANINMAMRQAPQPVICAVHGVAAGLGFSLSLSSDVRVICKDAKFSAAYINIGLGGADMACSYFLPRLIGAGRAYEYMLTGNFMSAEEAMQLGLASRLVDEDRLMDAALELAKTMAAKNPMGLRLTKEAINMNLDASSLEQALHLEDRNQCLLIARGLLEKEGRTSRYF
jgi:enoyl-CoA hydratase/carnithine racemase